MRASLILGRATLLSVVLILAGGNAKTAVALAQDIPNFTPAEMAQQFSQLTLQVRSLKNSYLQLEPVRLRLVLRNPTDKRMWGHTYLGRQLRYVTLFIRKSGTTEWHEWEEPLPFIARILVDDEWIAPQSIFVGQRVIRAGLNNALPEPGDYEVYATFRNLGLNNGIIQAAPITLSIVAPSGFDLQAYNYIMASGLATDFLGDTIGVNFPKDKLLTFNSDFGNSIYGVYVKFKLGQWYLFKKDYQAAEALFAQVAAQLDFPLLPAADNYLAQAREGLAQPEIAKPERALTTKPRRKSTKHF